MKSLNNAIDFELNTISNFLLQKSDSIDSLLTVEGQIGFDSTGGIKKIKYHNGTSVVSLVAASDLSSYLALAGGTMAGDISFSTASNKRLKGVSQFSASLGGFQHNNTIGLSDFGSNGGGINLRSELSSDTSKNSTFLMGSDKAFIMNTKSGFQSVLNLDGSATVSASQGSTYGSLFISLGNYTLLSYGTSFDQVSSLKLDPQGVGVSSEYAGYYAYLKTTNLTAERNFELPDTSGTLALTSNFSDYLPLAGGTMSDLLVLSGDPVASMGAATKNYVDNFVNGLSWKQSVVASTTANITLSGNQTIDGVAVVNGNRVLVKNQSTGSQNGIYVVASGSWTRAADNDTGDEIANTTVLCEAGTTNGGTQWNCSNSTITLGSTSITFVKIAGAGVYTNGSGLILSGNTFYIDSTVVATLSGSQTLYNKTLDGAIISNGLLTTSGTFGLFLTGSGAANSFIMTNAGTGSSPRLSVIGTDSNINLQIAPYGTAGYVEIFATSALKLPVGHTIARPTPENGMIRYNTTTKKFEGYENSGWKNMVMTIGLSYAISKGCALA